MWLLKKAQRVACCWLWRWKTKRQGIWIDGLENEEKVGKWILPESFQKETQLCWHYDFHTMMLMLHFPDIYSQKIINLLLATKFVAIVTAVNSSNWYNLPLYKWSLVQWQKKEKISPILSFLSIVQELFKMPSYLPIWFILVFSQFR